MRFSLASNFDDALIEQVHGTPVAEIFGKLPQDATGGGRASYQIVGVNQRRVADHVKAARAAGIGFNYLLNASCIDNLEFTRKGQREIRKLLDWIEQIGVESVTVSSPFLLRIVKEQHPQLRVRISVFAGVDHVRKAKMWEELGADCIMLDSILVNREFELLRAVRKAVRCELQLLVSNNCLQSCALSPYHMNTLAHASQSGHHTGGFFIDWCLLKCTQMKLQEPANYLRSEWIRPEDLHHYERLGYDSFKITERGAPTAVLVARVKAYAARHYEGNLLDLVQPFGFRDVSQADTRRGLLWRLRYLLRPFSVDLRRLWAMKKLAEERGMLGPQTGPPPVVVHNRKLAGFIDRFLTAGCKDMDCDACRHCHRFADKAVVVDPDYKERCLTLYDQVLDDMHSGKMWGLNSTSVPARHGTRHRETSRCSQ